MSSDSDSEDDCYANIAKKLQKMKNKYIDDKIETTNLLNESSDIIDDIVRLSAKTESNASSVSSHNIPEPAVSNLPDVSQELAPKTAKRVTRSSARNSGKDASTVEDLPPPRSKRHKKDSTTNKTPSNERGKSIVNQSTSRTDEQDKSNSATDGDANASTSRLNRGSIRGRGSRFRGRGSNFRGRGSSFRGRSMNTVSSFFDFFSALMPDNMGASIPTYSVGNTDEYYDQSAIQPLFSKTTENRLEDVTIVEDDNEENEELSVKVYWQSSEFFKFVIRKFQKLTQIFDYFAQKENVSHDKLLFTFNDKILKPDDTPELIGYTIVKFIDGGIVNQSVSHLTKDEDIKDGIKIKFQCQNVKKPFEITLRAEDKFSRAMMKCAEHLEKPLEKLRFEFDGDLITGNTTARELDLEGGECIDVKILS